MSQSSSAASDGSTSEIRQHHSDRRSSTPEYESRLPDLTDRQVNPHPEIQNDTGASPLAVLSTAPDAGVTTLPSGQAVATPVLLDLSESLNSKVKSIKTAKSNGLEHSLPQCFFSNQQCQKHHEKSYLWKALH